MKPVAKIYRVLAAVGESTTVSEIEESTGLDQDFIRNSLLILRARKQVIRLNEGRPNREVALFSITQAGRQVLADADPVESLPPVSMVAHALAQRSKLATVWARP